MLDISSLKQCASVSFVFIYFLVLHRFQHCTGHITTGNWKGRGNQYIQFVRVLYCKLPTNGKQLPAFPLEAVPGIEPQPQRWEARVLPLCHRGPCKCICTDLKSGWLNFGCKFSAISIFVHLKPLDRIIYKFWIFA